MRYGFLSNMRAGTNACTWGCRKHACGNDCLQHLQNETNPELLRQLRLFRDLVMFSTAFTEGRQMTLDLETAVIQAWQPSTNRNKLR